MDLALAMVKELLNHNCPEGYTSPPSVFSYDCACQYLIKLIERFKEDYPHLVEEVKHLWFTIPLVHVHNHKDDCTYLFACIYLICMAHFHGKTAEHVWLELNSLCGKLSQMNQGPHEELIIVHSGYWNHKKLMGMCMFSFHLHLTQQFLIYLQPHSWLLIWLLHWIMLPRSELTIWICLKHMPSRFSHGSSWTAHCRWVRIGSSAAYINTNQQSVSHVLCINISWQS